jgi:beta-lactamase class D
VPLPVPAPFSRFPMRLAVLLFLLPLAALAQPADLVRPDLAVHFERLGVEGTFVLRHLETGRTVRVNPERAAERFLPASTFKIFNALVALEEGAVRDEHEVLAWDGVDRGNPDWNQSQNLAAGFHRSTVWLYQELARRTGRDRLRQHLAREHYGNADTTGGVDRFWLTGGLRISADEQVDLLARLASRQLGFSREVQDTVFNIMVMERRDGATLRGKTGWGRVDGVQIGWLVGTVEQGEGTYAWAMNLETPDPNFPMMAARRQIVFGLLADLGVWAPAE